MCTTLSGAALTAAQQQFEAALPSMDRTFRLLFHTIPHRHRAEAIADARAAAWAAWAGLVRRGKDPLRVGVTGIAARCSLHIKAGRKVGNRHSGRGGFDVLDPRARRLGLTILRLDRHDGVSTGRDPEVWREWLCQDNRCTPADEASFRIDFESWLAGLPARKRQMALLLAEGHETGVAARLLGVTPAAVSIARSWLEASWRSFQGEEEQECASRMVASQGPIPRDRGRARPRRYAGPGRPRLKPASAARGCPTSLPLS